MGIGIDCAGGFCGQPSSVAVKRASDGELLCEPYVLNKFPFEDGVVTRKKDWWREVKVKFDIVDNTVDVEIAGVKVLDDVKFEGVQLPRTLCVGVCAGTSNGKTNHICVNKLKLKGSE